MGHKGRTIMNVSENWGEVEKIFRASFKSSFHYAVASVNENCEPHVTPIGSLMLGDPGHGFYFEKFPENLKSNLNDNKHICVLAVNSSKWFWFKSLFLGRFTEPPAVRLRGTVGEVRDATETELGRWQRRVRRVRYTKGHALIWAGMSKVRDIEFTGIEPVSIGEMTRGHWGASCD
jgi:hypothetical protein